MWDAAAVLAAALTVYLIAHWPALTNPYVINDDVRQQIYWMQQWRHPELYPDDLLTEYARNYVSWGVQAVYYPASFFIDPVQFTKVVAGILYLVTAGFLFGIGLRFGNRQAAIMIVCIFFFFETFLRKISGGLPQSFAFPLLLGYLFFLGRNNMLGCSLVILLQSIFNPYVFILCGATHGIFLACHYGPRAFMSVRHMRMARVQDGGLAPESAGPKIQPRTVTLAASGSIAWGRLMAVHLPIIAGAFLMVWKYAFLQHAAFGSLLARSAMLGKPEYGPQGRYELIPGTRFLYEVFRPWEFFLPVHALGSLAGCVGLALVILVVCWAFTRKDRQIDTSGFRIFYYLLPASVILYVVSQLLFMKLFVPRRYLEFSLNIFYCVVLGLAITVAGQSIRSLGRKAFLVLVGILAVIGGLRNYNIGIYDYSAQTPLYNFVRTTAPASLFAGPPELMDNSVTFGGRKALVTYELSHTWIDRYWEVLKKRTQDFFDAYYSDDPETILRFATNYGVDYLVVREDDFSPEHLTKGRVYFEPFDSQVKNAVKGRTHFAIMDRNAFPPVYQNEGIRVIKLNGSLSVNHRHYGSSTLCRDLLPKSPRVT